MTPVSVFFFYFVAPTEAQKRAFHLSYYLPLLDALLCEGPNFRTIDHYRLNTPLIRLSFEKNKHLTFENLVQLTKRPPTKSNAALYVFILSVLLKYNQQCIITTLHYLHTHYKNKTDNMNYNQIIIFKTNIVTTSS